VDKSVLIFFWNLDSKFDNTAYIEVFAYCQTVFAMLVFLRVSAKFKNSNITEIRIKSARLESLDPLEPAPAPAPAEYAPLVP